ncbi:hypothetical protein DACRYDRAFT_24842 [Dacryopinax primogenitus]|uniref:Uncharacterized protein n=1 Tax=Dacryopinax primogenitus (strain DJM 731) TaxID=1858805 RepID=M5FNT9_DACPD|nr:uncharacterized protein DACRYDRAFT_24842 [Dacryopinax primogenitus]EJT97920.1 hypothetical protein DACRYDRAFT_24842 [Dacryopinax primogenitus]
MSNLSRAHTHPTTRPLTSLSELPPPHPQRKSRTAAPTPTRSPPTRSPQLRAIPRSALASPLEEREEDPFGVAGFYGPAAAESFGWVREEGRTQPGEGDDGEEKRLDGEEELGMDECVRRVLSMEDRMGVLGISLPQLSRTPSSGSPSPPRQPPTTYAYTTTTTSNAYTYAYHSSDAPYPETDDGLHESFAARTKAMSYPDLVMLASKRAPSSTVPAGLSARGRKGMASLSPRPAPVSQTRTRAEVIYTTERRESSLERRTAVTSTMGVEPELGGLFFDGLGEKQGQGVGVEGAREGWRVWALDRAAKVVGLE